MLTRDSIALADVFGYAAVKPELDETVRGVGGFGSTGIKSADLPKKRAFAEISNKM